jgi:uncharacterized membrane protein
MALPAAVHLLALLVLTVAVGAGVAAWHGVRVVVELYFLARFRGRHFPPPNEDRR